MAIGTLSIDLVARLARFEQDMGKAARATEKSASQMSSAFGAVKASLAGLAAALGASLGVAGLVTLTRAAIDSLDALNDLKDATGASIENISALEDVAARTGTSFDTVGTSLIKFNNALKESKPGSDIEAALTAIGLSAKELKQLDPAEALLRTAKALAGFADDGDKARRMQELFGKSLREVAPFMKDLAEKGALVATVTTKQAEEAEKLNKEFFAMQKNVQDLARSLAGALIPGLNAAIDKFRTAKTEGTGWFASMNSLAAKANAQKSAGFTGSWAEGDAGRGKINPEFVKPSIGDLPDRPKGGGGGRASGGRVKTELDLTNKEIDTYIANLQRQIDSTKDLTKVEEAHLWLTKKGTGATLEKAAEVLKLAGALDKEADELERINHNRKIAIDAGDQVERDNAAFQSKLKSLTGDTPSAKLNEQLQNEILLREARAANIITEETYLQAINANFDLTNEKLVETKSLAEDLGLTFASAFEDAIISGKGLGGILKGLEQDILRIVTRKLVTEPLGNAISNGISGMMGGSGGGAGGGMLSSLFSFLPKFATGTDYVPRDMAAIIHKGERIVPASQNNGGGGGRTMNITINPPAGMSRQSSTQFAADVARQLRLAESRNS